MRKEHPFKSSREAKRSWLRERQDRYVLNGIVDETAVTALAQEMQDAGLYGPHTPFIDVRWSVRNLIELLEREK